MKKELFYTKPKSDAGIKLQLERPDGTPTDEFLIVRGIDSDAFQQKQIEVRSAILREMKEDESDEHFDAIQQRHKIDLLASLVAGWSFDKKCKLEDVKEFLTNAPHIADKIDSISADRVFFMQTESDASAK